MSRDIGQRISTALAVIAAEELDVPLKIPNRHRRGAGRITSGSNSMMSRPCCATRDGNRSATHVNVETQRATHTNRSVAYEEIQGNNPFEIDVDLNVDVKDPTTHRIVGEKISPLGLSEMVTGEYRFLHDMKMDGMVHARVVRPPHYKARLNSLDEDLTARLQDSGTKNRARR